MNVPTEYSNRLRDEVEAKRSEAVALREAGDEANALRAEASASSLNAERSFEECDTDGFLTQWASGLTARLNRAKADLLDAGGIAEFPALYDLDGNRVRAKLIDGRYGRVWMVLDPDGNLVEWVKPYYKRESTINGKGYRYGTEFAPAGAFINGSGTGLSGNAWVEVVRLDEGKDGTDPRVRKGEVVGL